MAISWMTPTQLPLDEYARMMAIPGWLFNQVIHPGRPTPGGSAQYMWFQSGYSGEPSMIVGRDEVAQAVAMAEHRMARFLGFWMGDKWICNDERVWPVPKRGTYTVNPEHIATWGEIRSGGVEAWTLIAEGVAPAYSDRDGDDTLDWATVTQALLYDEVSDACEVVIVPGGKDPTEAEWRIRPLDIAIDAVVGITAQGPRWLFVHPDHWLTVDRNGSLSDDSYFIQGGIYDDGVDIYRHYNDTSTQAQIVWKPGSESLCDATAACVEVCQSACLSILNKRVGIVRATPANYSAGTFTRAAFVRSESPQAVRMWYYSGYDDDYCMDCTQLGPMMKEAIVRLANVYMIECPCGYEPTSSRFERDNEEMSIDSMHVEMVQNTFGSTARGAQFAYNVCTSIPPLGKGG